MSRTRDYDIVLWGATGFTGRYVAEYLAERYGDTDLNWAIAGRSSERLKDVRDRLVEINRASAGIDVLTGDAFDPASLDAIAERTEVVCSCVGPYAEYGSNLVEACIERGTDYCDLTGEIHWMRRMIDLHHEEALDEEVRIVHGCGFDSVPSDLGTLLVQNYANEQFDTSCSSVDTYVSTSASSMSGGTYASITGTYDAMSGDSDARRAVRSPYSLAPEGERTGPDDGVQLRPAYDDVVGQWTAPFVFAIINEKVVRRSNALLGYPWGRDFRYREVTPTGPGPTGALEATVTSFASALFGGAMSISPLRALVSRFVHPNPGEGPSRDAVEDNSFEVWLVGTGRGPGSDGEFTVEGRIAADRHLGYGATPWMVGEAAVCLARGETDTPLPGGVLTPATGVGAPLADRLRDAGMTISVNRRSPPDRRRAR